MRWYVPSTTWIIAPPFEQDLLYQEAVAWAREFSPEAEKDSYAAALDHAKQKYATSVSHFDALDKKADDLMRISVTVAALLVAAVSAFKVQMTGWLLGAFLSFLASVILCAIARRPSPQATPGNVREVLGFVEDFRIRDRHQIEALLAASLHCAVVGIQPQIRWKSEQISRATALFVTGILLLLSITLRKFPLKLSLERFRRLLPKALRLRRLLRLWPRLRRDARLLLRRGNFVLVCRRVRHRAILFSMAEVNA